MTFWRLVDDLVTTDGSYSSLKLAKYVPQTVDLKSTNVANDGALLHHANLKIVSSHPGWEHTSVPQLLQPGCLNLFLAWRIFERRDLLRDVEALKCLDSFTNAANDVQETANFMINAALDLPAEGRTPQLDESETSSNDEVHLDEYCKLAMCAALGKRRRLEFLSCIDCLVLQLRVPGRWLTVASNCNCAVDGQHKDWKRPYRKSWRVPRSPQACSSCSISLRFHFYPWLTHSLCELWHATKIPSLSDVSVPRKVAGGLHTDPDGIEDWRVEVGVPKRFCNSTISDTNWDVSSSIYRSQSTNSPSADVSTAEIGAAPIQPFNYRFVFIQACSDSYIFSFLKNPQVSILTHYPRATGW